MAKPLKALRQALRADLKGDTRFTANQLDAIFGNLRTTGAGLAQGLTETQSRELAAIQRLVARTEERSGTAVARTGARLANKYGSAMGQAIETALGPAAGVAKATGLGTTAAAKGAGLLAKGGQTALALQQGSVAEAAAGAQYALASAYRYRAGSDAQLVAERRLALQQMRMDHRFAMESMERQYQLEWENRRKELDYLNGVEREGKVEGITASASIAAGAFPELQRLFNTEMADTDNDGKPDSYPTSPAQVASKYIADNGIVPESPEAAFIMSIASAMYRAGAGALARGAEPGSSDAWLGRGGLYGPGASEQERADLILDAVVERLISQYPQFADEADHIRAAIASETSAYVVRDAITAGQAAVAATGDSASFGEGIGRYLASPLRVISPAAPFIKSPVMWLLSPGIKALFEGGKFIWDQTGGKFAQNARA